MSKHHSQRTRPSARFPVSLSTASLQTPLPGARLHDRFGAALVTAALQGEDFGGLGSIIRRQTEATQRGSNAQLGNAAMLKSMGKTTPHTEPDDLLAAMMGPDEALGLGDFWEELPAHSADSEHNSPGMDAQFESGEHAELGDGAGFGEDYEMHGEVVTLGEINALADFYATFAAMQADDDKRFRTILAHLRLEMASPGSVSPQTWDAITGGEYTALAQANEAHFGASNPQLVADSGEATASNRSTWQTNFREAMRLASLAIQVRDTADSPETVAALQADARAQNAFGEHFLTDAYSAGHLFNKADYMQQTRDALWEVSTRKKQALFDAVAQQVWTQHATLLTQYDFRTVESGWLYWRDLDEASDLAEVMMLVDQIQPQIVENAAVRAAHDRLNRYPGGVQVVAGGQRPFSLPGDGTLRTSPEAQRVAMLALEVGRVMVATATPNHNVDAAVSEMSTWFPVPTSNGRATVKAVLSDVSAVEGGMTNALSAVLSTEIASVVAGLVAGTVLRPKAGVKPKPVGPSPVTPSPDAPQPDEGRQLDRIHRVVPGDWLSTISESYYGDAMRYPEIFEANKNLIADFDDPDVLQVGWQLVIP